MEKKEIKNKIVIDIATHLGYAFIKDGKIVRSGHIELDLNRKTQEYASSEKRKNIPNLKNEKDKWVKQDDGYYHKIKERKVITKNNLNQQLSKLANFIDMYVEYENCDVVLEAPAVVMGKININSIKKQFALYGVVNLVSKKVEEIKPNEWFSYMLDFVPRKPLYNQDKRGQRKIDRKKTSIMWANDIMEMVGSDKVIKDHNEADALCIAKYLLLTEDIRE